MLCRELGTSGIEASVVALGTWAIGGWMWGGTDEADAIKAINAAIDNGVTLIDTAPMYGFGLSEEIVGKAIRGKRNKVCLATKCGMIWDSEQGKFFFHTNEKTFTREPSTKKVYRYLGPESISQEVELSLQRLGTDVIDLYQTHWQDTTTPIDDTMAVLQKLKDQGKIRAIGISNVTLDDVKAYGQIASVQEKYSMLYRNIEENGVLEYCRQNSIAMLAYSPLGQGLLTGKLTPDRKFAEGDQRKDNQDFSVERRQTINTMLEEFAPICEQHNCSISQLVIAWTFSQPGLTHVLAGARTEKQAIENAAAGDISLSQEELQTMENILKKHL